MQDQTDTGTAAAPATATASDPANIDPVIAPPARATGYSWYVLAVLVIVYILNFIDRQIVSILAVDIKRDLALSDAEMGFLGGAAFAVFYALFGVPLGRLADNWSRVRLLAIGLTLWSTMTALSGMARNYVTLSFARMGVGIGEATASPTAYSLISDYFPKHQRATALAIYSSGLFLGGGVSLWLGAEIVQRWNNAYPGGGPLGLVGWQAAFLVVGIPGVLLALWVATLREPARGVMDGIASPVSPTPFRDFFRDLSTIVPPFTLYGAWQRGMGALVINFAVAVLAVAFALMMIRITENVPQWSAIALGYYAIFSWATTLRARDPATFRLIWGTPAFLCTALGYGMVSLVSYALSFWGAPYAIVMLGRPASEVGFWLGATGALGGFLGVIIGGWIADKLRARMANGRILIIMLGVLGPLLPIWYGLNFASPGIAAALNSVTALFGVAPMEPAGATFYAMNFIAGVLGSSALGAAAATTQDLVLPRMRGTATAAFFLATTLVGLAMGPYLAGLVSDWNPIIVNGAEAGNIRTGLITVTFGAVPIAMALLLYAFVAVPRAEATIAARAAAAERGE